jgi:hypothetical protein
MHVLLAGDQRLREAVRVTPGTSSIAVCLASESVMNTDVRHPVDRRVADEGVPFRANRRTGRTYSVRLAS